MREWTDSDGSPNNGIRFQDEEGCMAYEALNHDQKFYDANESERNNSGRNIHSTYLINHTSWY